MARPDCGTGGTLSAGEDHIKALNPDATVEVYGQELNPESWAICRPDLMIKGQDPENIRFGNSFPDDGHARRKFDYLLADHIDNIAGRRQHFGPDKGYKSSLDRSARKAAWRMIRREKGLDDDI